MQITEFERRQSFKAVEKFFVVIWISPSQLAYFLFPGFQNSREKNYPETAKRHSFFEEKEKPRVVLFLFHCFIYMVIKHLFQDPTLFLAKQNGLNSIRKRIKKVPMQKAIQMTDEEKEKEKENTESLDGGIEYVWVKKWSVVKWLFSDTEQGWLYFSSILSFLCPEKYPEESRDKRARKKIKIYRSSRTIIWIQQASLVFRLPSLFHASRFDRCQSSPNVYNFQPSTFCFSRFILLVTCQEKEREFWGWIYS